MRYRQLLTLLVLLALTGCATMPTGPSVRVLPAPGKTFEAFMSEDATCRQWASQLMDKSPQEVMNRNTANSAILGTAIGAAAGAAFGAIGGDAGTGAAIGGGTGLLFGTASGSGYGERYGSEAQMRYDNTYVQCMYAKGNQVPGSMVQQQVPARSRVIAPPPPSGYPVPPDYR
jgi:uncharacterized protein YceK